ncbi:MAG: thioredoxin-dependent peroxiredoxin [Mycobacterium sp.]|nr:thioredoxin-dependent peroxiredoxin [Mycobacterium sp.]MDT5172400.1 thioredoxin-dependent peroxiredoxin [Mycobacterium sp.]MDT5201889.1 thioredoxin-dependent peroxiredoxin [Mycobacterium sp.]MDT5254134.1 thioredoxin-dependent peroxiredoxin [Mycobacterium sp.]
MTDTARLAPGDKAPAFTLPDADGKKVSLADYKGRRVIVYFYPAASTPGCTKQACDFRDSLGELNGAGLDVVGISPDKPEKLAKFRDAEGLTFPLLSDPDRQVLTAWGAYGGKQMYGKTVTGVIRRLRHTS